VRQLPAEGRRGRANRARKQRPGAGHSRGGPRPSERLDSARAGDPRAPPRGDLGPVRGAAPWRGRPAHEDDVRRRALRPPGRALAMIHTDPARAWTVAALADELAMSRSAFAARFTELVGEPAMQYVTRWRMRMAVNALRDERATVAELANRLGYRSEAAFAR